ncbi:hypothetical protein BGX38DRAFT_765044 [Terfezia claveryi]|nr:hypothetical protein BGX38DRAFT_765044 [Terfezia claveryi]
MLSILASKRLLCNLERYFIGADGCANFNGNSGKHKQNKKSSVSRRILRAWQHSRHYSFLNCCLTLHRDLHTPQQKMPRTRRYPPKRISSSPEAQDPDIEFFPARALIASSQPGPTRRASKTPLKTPSKRKPAAEVPGTPSKRRCRSSSTGPKNDGDLPSNPKSTSQTKENQRQEETHASDEWVIPFSESGVMVGEDQISTDAESSNGGRQGDSDAEREKEYERDQQYRWELKRRASELRDLEFKARGKVQTSLRTYATRDVRRAIPTPQALFKKRDPTWDDSTRTIEINDDGSEGEYLEQDAELQEAFRRSLRDTHGGPPSYRQLVPENSKAEPVTKPQHPSLPEPGQVPTIGKSDSLSFLKISLEVVDVPLHPTAPKAKVMTVRFPFSLVGKNDLLHCVSTHGTSILFVWSKGVVHGTQNNAIDLENLDLNSSQRLPGIGKIYPGGRGMGKIEIPDGYNIMRTTENIKCCDTGSGFSMREYLIGISREREQKKGEGAWVVVRVGIVSVEGVTHRSLMPPLIPRKVHGGRHAILPVSLGEEGSHLSAVKPVNLFGAKTVRLSDFELQKAKTEAEVEMPRNYKSLGEVIAEEEKIADGEMLRNPSERIRKRGELGKDGSLGVGYDNGLEEGVGTPVKKFKINPKEKRVVDRERKEGRTIPPMGQFTSPNGVGAEGQHGTAVLGRHPKVVIPVKGKMQEELNGEEEVKGKQKEKEQERGETGKAGNLTRNAQKVHPPGLGRVRVVRA